MTLQATHQNVHSYVEMVRLMEMKDVMMETQSLMMAATQLARLSSVMDVSVLTVTQFAEMA